MRGRTAGEKVGAFVAAMRAGEPLPEVVHQVARAFVDTFAVAAGGWREPAAEIARDYVLADGAGGAATLWANGERVRPEDAALANAVAAHVLDFDDVTSPQRGHPSAVLLPALVAVGEAADATGAQISAAYAAGFELIVKLSRAMAFGHYARGWHSTSTLGVIGAAAGCAFLLALTADQTSAAVGIAVAHAAGVRRSFGTMAKSLQPAQAAAAAVRAARLAAKGYSAPPDALDGTFGFMDLYANGEDLHAQLDTLGEPPLELSRAGLEVKKYPCCYATHRALQGIQDLVSQRPIRASEVERVLVTVQPKGLAPLIHKRPWHGLEAKFSMEYTVAAMLLDGAVRLESFSDSAVQRPEAQALLRKVEAFEEEGDPWPRRALVEVELRNGERRSLRVDELRGSAKLPLSDAELKAKLRDCVAFGRFEMEVDRFLDAVWSWGDRSIREVLRSR